MQPDFVTVTKFDAMRSQLDTAIGLWFSDADPIATHTLASASHEILHILYSQRGLKHLFYDEPSVAEKDRKVFRAAIKRSANFFKHASRDVDAKLAFNKSTNEALFFFSIIGLGRMNERLTMVENAFMLWFYLNSGPEFVYKRPHDDPYIKSFEDLIGIPKQQFFIRYAARWNAAHG
jgi:hypothetical protein